MFLYLLSHHLVIFTSFDYITRNKRQNLDKHFANPPILTAAKNSYFPEISNMLL